MGHETDRPRQSSDHVGNRVEYIGQANPPGVVGVEQMNLRFKNALIALGAIPIASFLILVGVLGPFGFLLWLGVCGLAGWLAFKLVMARGQALKAGDVDVLPDILKFVAWNPTEGVVFLKNKTISHVDDDSTDGGGMAMLFPFLGEELALRVPLEIQTTNFSDHNVLTKEYVPLGIKCSIYWRIVKLEPFYLFVSREIHYSSDTRTHEVVKQARQPQMEAAEQWLQNMAEEETRKTISSISTGLLLASRVADELDLGGGRSQQPSATKEYSQATDGLAELIFKALNDRVAQYGIGIHRVALQEVVLPPDVCQAATNAAKSAYLPLIAQREASAAAIKSQSRLRADAEVIGIDAVAARELLNVSPNSPVGALAEFLNDWLARGAAQGTLTRRNDSASPQQK